MILSSRYDMRRECQLIASNVYLGPYACARDRGLLAKMGITHLLCCLDGKEQRIMRVQHPDLNYLCIQVTDSHSENLIPHFPHARQFLQTVLATPAHKVLVYCNNGMSRSPCFVIAYLMEAMNWDFPTAYGYVQNRRFCISPNDNFKMQLKEYQHISRARGMVAPVAAEILTELFDGMTAGPAQRQGAKRRQLDEDDEYADRYREYQNTGYVIGGAGSGDIDMS
ncbi:protein-tyrosine phosphatase-like protein [Chytriomyces sp. MP71]|nr:protein-tyrosine phosphatase-like protein [Chytriomyces sp. MP71]